MFDFNGDGRTDSGEQFIGYQMFKNTTKGMSNGAKHSRRLDGWEKLIIALFVWQVLNLIIGGGR